MPTFALERRKSHSQSEPGSVRHGIHVVRGSDSILRMREMLIELSLRCGQPGTMEDVTYFLSKPGLLKRVPQLCLIAKRQNLLPEQIRVDDLLGHLLLYEYEVMGFGSRSFG